MITKRLKNPKNVFYEGTVYQGPGGWKTGFRELPLYSQRVWLMWDYSEKLQVWNYLKYVIGVHDPNQGSGPEHAIGSSGTTTYLANEDGDTQFVLFVNTKKIKATRDVNVSPESVIVHECCHAAFTIFRELSIVLPSVDDDKYNGGTKEEPFCYALDGLFRNCQRLFKQKPFYELK